jgi:adenine phosphoribosyltransferase
VFASAVSYLLKKPFIMFRKKNKLPADTYSVDFELEYGTATIEVHKDSIDKGDSVLIIDDLIATGGTAEAAAKLVEMSGAKVAAFIFTINLFDLNGSNNLVKKGYKVENLMDFPGH